jgi:D-alanyl-D-alanine carboxypeptidase (penicillin-binding protein 5/6)
MRYPGAIGGKTGYTNAARKTFIGAADRNGRRLVVAMMYGLVRDGGPTYWDQAATLLDWGFTQNPAAAVATL